MGTAMPKSITFTSSPAGLTRRISTDLFVCMRNNGDAVQVIDHLRNLQQEARVPREGHGTLPDARHLGLSLCRTWRKCCWMSGQEFDTIVSG